MVSILIFRDSVTAGAWDREFGGWVNRLASHIYQNHKRFDTKYLVYNLGISGDGTKELLARFENEITARRVDEKKHIILVEIGINDSWFVNKTKKFNVTLQQFEANIKAIIKIAKKYNSKIIFIGLTPVDQTKVDPMPWALAISYKENAVRKYNEAIKSICSAQKVPFVDIFGRISKDMLEDGAHPNSAGHKIIFETVTDFLVKEKLI